MVTAHDGEIDLLYDFDQAYKWLKGKVMIELTTEAGTSFSAQASHVVRGQRKGELVIRMFQGNTEYARAYKCCWGHYYNCNRTRIGMYCLALDANVN